MITEQITYDHKITEIGHIERRTILKYIDDTTGEVIATKYHRRAIDPILDIVEEEDAMTKRLVQLLKNPAELDEIMAGIEETETIEEGETAEGEAAEKLTWFGKLAALFK